MPAHTDPYASTYCGELTALGGGVRAFASADGVWRRHVELRTEARTIDVVCVEVAIGGVQ